MKKPGKPRTRAAARAVRITATVSEAESKVLEEAVDRLRSELADTDELLNPEASRQTVIRLMIKRLETELKRKKRAKILELYPLR